MRKRMIAGILVAGLCFGGWYVWQENRVYIEMAKEVIVSKNEKTKDNKMIEAPIEQSVAMEGAVDVVESESTPMTPPEVEQNSGIKGQTETAVKPEETSNIANDQEAALVKDYREKFAALRDEYQGKINALLVQAKEEYLAVPEEKRETAKFTLGLKYLKKGKALEDECDDRFEALLAQMKKELQKNGFTTDEVKIAQTRYEGEKQARQRALMEKMLSRD